MSTITKNKNKAKTAKVAKPSKKTPKDITNLIIIDASGSMLDKVAEVKGGLKKLFKEINADVKKDVGITNIKTVVTDFSGAGDFRTLVDTEKGDKLEDQVPDNYKVRGMTALYDAIAKSFGLIPTKQKTVFVSIITDGEENDSKEFAYEAIKNLIDEKTKLGWTITFMGTTQEAIKHAVHMGIFAGNTMSFTNDAKGAARGMSGLSHSRTAYYASNYSEGGTVQMGDLMAETEKELDKEDGKTAQDPKNIKDDSALGKYLKK